MRGSQPASQPTSQPTTLVGVSSPSDNPSFDKSRKGTSSGSPNSDDPLLQNAQKTTQDHSQPQTSKTPYNRNPVRVYNGMSGNLLTFAISLVAGLDFLYVLVFILHLV